MRAIRVDPKEPSQRSLAKAVDVLESGGLVAFPTETVYGLCVDASNAAAVERLYAAKGRGERKPCAFLLPDRAAVSRFAPGLPRIAARIADRYWPGPVTLIVPSHENKAIGLRVPALGLPRALARACPRPLLQTSANRAGSPAALNRAAVFREVGEHVGLLLDGGRAPGGRSSTVVACDGRAYVILRRGAVSRRQIVAAATELTLVACTGNICLSPFAAVLLAKELAGAYECDADALLARYAHRVESFGTMGLEGNAASDYSVQVARDYDLDLSEHRARPFTIALANAAERVYCLARGHHDFLAPYFDARPDALQMLDPEGQDIDDPYGKPLRTYKKAAERMAAACRARARELAGLENGDPA